MKNFVPFLLLALFVCCSRDSGLLRQLEAIRTLSNADPARALMVYDSLRQSGTVATGEYARMKYDLLGIRVRDKNGILPESDSLIRAIVAYFEHHGSNQELQEAYYYAGSVYRDMKDFPRAINYTLMSSERAGYGDIDSLLQRNCFSQLYLLYHNVQDYGHALEAAEKECAIAERIGELDDTSLIHVSNTLLRIDSVSIADEMMQRILEHQQKLSPECRDTDIMFDLLYSYSRQRHLDKANACFSLLEEMGAAEDDNFAKSLTLAEYYHAKGDITTCIQYFDRVIGWENLEGEYNAYRNLFRLYAELGDSLTAWRCAERYLNVSTKLDLGLRQQQAATVNNQYQYYRNEIEEQRLINDRQSYRLRMYCAIGGVIFLLLMGLLLHYYRKNKRITRLSNLAGSIRDTRQAAREKQQELHEEEQLIAAIRESIESRQQELASLEQDLYAQKDLVQKKIVELACVTDRLKQTEDELQRNRDLLADKTEQTQYLYALQQQSDLKADATTMLALMKDFAAGKVSGQELDWEMFIAEVNKLHPEFAAQVYEKLGRLKPLQLRTCYLLKAGFTKPQVYGLIANDVSRTTAWRWIKVYSEALAELTGKSLGDVPCP